MSSLLRGCQGSKPGLASLNGENSTNRATVPASLLQVLIPHWCQELPIPALSVMCGATFLVKTEQGLMALTWVELIYSREGGPEAEAEEGDD